MKDVILPSAVTVINSLPKIKDAALSTCSINYIQDFSNGRVCYTGSIT